MWRQTETGRNTTETVSEAQSFIDWYQCPVTASVGCCCCCSAYLSSCHRTVSDANLLDDLHTFYYNDYFIIGGIRNCLGVSDDPMFLWISSNSCPLNLLLVWSHQAETIIVKRFIQGRNNVTRVRIEPRPFEQGRRKNDAFTDSATLPTRRRKNDAFTHSIYPSVRLQLNLIPIQFTCCTLENLLPA